MSNDTAIVQSEDRRGVVIHSGDVLFNPMDAGGWHRVIADSEGNLYLGDYESPLERYSPHEFWEIVDAERYGEDDHA